MPRYKITIEYDGTNLVGWQRQNEGQSAQQFLQEAIFEFSREKVDVYGSGRTDAGVHARGQVAHFDLTKDFDPYNVQHGINFYLKNAPVSVLGAELVSEEFNARFSAKKRYYRYHMINRAAPLTLDKTRAWLVSCPLDIGAMQNAANFLIGKHDFTSFRASECQSKSAVKTLDEITITQQKENIYLDFAALSFLHHMVRNIVGTLMLVGKGKWCGDDIKRALAAKNRSASGPTAPACGLYFMKVEY